VAHTGGSLPVAVLTNNPYESSLSFYERRPQGYGTTSSLDRFCTAAARTEAFAEELPADARAYAFSILAAVAQPGYTRWSIVYEIAERRVHFRTDRLPAFRSLDISNLDFSCEGTVRVLNLGTQVSGDISGYLEPYTFDDNRTLIEFAYRFTPFLDGTPQSVLDEIAAYPDSTRCVGSVRVRRPSGRRVR
jgi:choloylglycine hydrolase